MSVWWLLLPALAAAWLWVPLPDPFPAEAGETPARGRRRPRWWPGGSAQADLGEHLVQLVAALGPALQVGLPPAEAIGAALASVPAPGPGYGSLRERVAQVAAAARDGEPLGPRWIALGRELDLPVAVQLGRAWTVSDRLGSPLAGLVSSVDASARAAQRHHRAVDAATAGPRATMQLLTLLPVLGVGVLPVVGVSPAQAYPPPVLLLAVLPGVLLILAGRRMVAAMTQRALRPQEVGRR